MPKISSPRERNLGEMLRLKELDIEMCRLDLKEKNSAMNWNWEKWRRTCKDSFFLREFELKQSSLPMFQSQSDEFDVNKYICLEKIFHCV